MDNTQKSGGCIVVEGVCFTQFDDLLKAEATYHNNALYIYLNELFTFASNNDGEVYSKDFCQYCEDNGLPVNTYKNSRYLKLLVEKSAITKIGNRKTARFFFDKKSVIKVRTILNQQTQKLASNKSAPRAGKVMIQEQKSLFEGIGIQTIDASRTVAFLSDKLFCGIVDNVMRDSYRDTRTVIEDVLILGYGEDADRIGIKAVCTSDSSSELIAIPDKRLIRVLDSYISSQIRAKYIDEISSGTFEFSMVKNSFVLDVNDLCSEIGISTNGGGPQNMRNMIFRLKDTRYQLDAERAPKFMSLISEVRKFIGDEDDAGVIDLYEQNQFDITYFSRISHDMATVINKSKQVNTRAPRLYLAEVNKLHLGFLCLGIIAKTSAHATLMLTHEGLKTDRTLNQKVYDWCKAHIGVRGTRSYTYTWETFAAKCFGSMRPINAYNGFLNGIQRYIADKPELEFDEYKDNKPISVYGYFIHWQGEPETVLEYCKSRRHGCKDLGGGKYRPILTFWRDRSDQLVGDNSFHNKKIAERKTELLRDGIQQSNKSESSTNLDKQQWRPSKSVESDLEVIGVDRLQINVYADEFKDTLAGPYDDDNFFEFVKAKVKNSRKIMTEDWTPGPKTVANLLSIGMPEKYLQTESAIFRLSKVESREECDDWDIYLFNSVKKTWLNHISAFDQVSDAVELNIDWKPGHRVVGLLLNNGVSELMIKEAALYFQDMSAGKVSKSWNKDFIEYTLKNKPDDRIF